MINLKKCKKCGELFDIDTSQDWCPACRKLPKITKANEYDWGDKE